MFGNVYVLVNLYLVIILQLYYFIQSYPESVNQFYKVLHIIFKFLTFTIVCGIQLASH